MKITLTIFFVLFALFSFSQDVKKKKESLNNGKATYYVLRSDMTTKHGEYSVKAYTGKAILVSGMYSQGKKEGKWIERYYRKGRNLKSVGYFKNDEPIGKWTFHNTKGEVVQEYDFDGNKIISSTECGDEIESEVFLDGQLTRKVLDCPASYIGGKEVLTYELLQKITRSFDFKANNEGRTMVKFKNVISFFINKNGEVENIEFQEKVEIPNLKEFIEKQILEKKGKWIVGELNGKKVKSKIKLGLSISMMF